MRTHFLKDLGISGKEKALQIFPDFDFYRLRRIVRLQWESHFDEDGEKATADLIMTTTYDTGPTSMAEVTLRFGGVVRAKLPELFPLVFLSEIEVEDVRDAQLEGICYKVKDFGEAEFEVECKNFEIISMILI